MLFAAGNMAVEVGIPGQGHLHAAVADIAVGLILLMHGLQLCLQRGGNDQRQNDADNQGDQQIFAGIKGEAVEIAVEVVAALVGEDSPCLLVFGCK